VPRSREALLRLAPLLACVAAALLVYARTLSYPFVLDDQMVIVQNDFIKTPASLSQVWLSDYSRGTLFGPGYFRPLMMFTLALEGLLLGWSPWHFHLINVLLHALAAWSLYLTGRALACRRGPALAAALLFAVFPPGQEAVGSIVGRCDILATLFLLLGWRAQILWERGRGSTARACALVFALGSLAMLGKENGVVFAGVIGLSAVGFLLGARRTGGRAASGHGVLAHGAIAAAASGALVVYLALRRSAVGGIGLTAAVSALSTNPVASLEQPQRTWAALYGTGRILLGVLGLAPVSVPLALGRGRPLPLAGLLDVRVLAPALCLAVLGPLAAALVARARPSGAALGLFLLALLPATNLVVVGAAFVADRFLYLPFAGLALAAAIGWQRSVERAAGSIRRRGTGRILAAGLIVLWGILASGRVSAWRSEQAIAEFWTRQFPWQAMGWNHTGLAALERGDLPAARQAFERSVEIDSNDATIQRYLGTTLGRLGLWKDSTERLRRAAELEPGDVGVRTDLAQALLAQGDASGALEEARAAHALRPSYFAAQRALATALFDTARYAEAAAEFRQLLGVDPHSSQLHSALILALYRDGRFAEAEEAAREAVRRDPGDPEFDLWCASLSARLGRREQAIADLQEASRKNGPVGLWLRKMDELGSLLGDPRVRALTGGG